MDWSSVIFGTIQTIAIGLLMFYWQRKQAKADHAAENRAAIRKQESLLSLEMTMANGKLSYAVAMAVKRGAPNGEIEEGEIAYEAARKRYLAFINEQAADNITR